MGKLYNDYYVRLGGVKYYVMLGVVVTGGANNCCQPAGVVGRKPWLHGGGC